MMEFGGDDIKTATVRRLLEAFPGIAVYKEAVSKPTYPHFFVRQIDLSDELDRRGIHLLTYSMNVRYRAASDSSTVLNLEQALDEMGLRLSECLNLLDFGDRKIRCLEKSAEKEDGVLQFFFKTVAMAFEKKDENIKKFDKLKVNVGLNGQSVQRINSLDGLEKTRR